VEFPLVRQPSTSSLNFVCGQVHQQLGEIQLRIKLVPAAGAGQAGQNCRGATATRVATNKEFFLFNTTRFISRSLTLLSMGNCVIRAENVQLRPVIQGVVHRIGHGMLRQQLLFPNQQLLPQFGQHGHRLLLTNFQALGGRRFPAWFSMANRVRQQRPRPHARFPVPFFRRRQTFRLACDLSGAQDKSHARRKFVEAEKTAPEIAREPWI